MPSIDYLDIEPFEICSIRPPTENFSLTFRLTRNCYWNKCAFCPVYKTGSKFSKRPIDDVIKDIRRAKKIDDFLFESGVGFPVYGDNDYAKLQPLIERVQRARWEAGIIDNHTEPDISEDTDPRLRWFANWFKDKPTIQDSFTNILTWRIGGSKTCFLGDADSLILDPAYMESVMKEIKKEFPAIERFTIYGRTRSASQLRSVRELKRYHAAGLNRVHFGLESGSDSVLSMIQKGVTAAQHIDGCRKTKEAGLSCSVYIMPGLGGAALSEEHAHETARVINEIGPDFVRLRTLEIFARTRLESERSAGIFTECSEEQVIREIRTIVSGIKIPVEFLSDSASNLLDISGRLPAGRESMLTQIDEYLELSPRKKLEFSLHSRIQSFMGQYGGLTDDIYESLNPYIRNNSLDLGTADDGQLDLLIRQIRARLMP
jgi:radical SAM superfamily enzyme YgiQ (UPF0313 family)